MDINLNFKEIALLTCCSETGCMKCVYDKICCAVECLKVKAVNGCCVTLWGKDLSGQFVNFVLYKVNVCLHM